MVFPWWFSLPFAIVACCRPESVISLDVQGDRVYPFKKNARTKENHALKKSFDITMTLSGDSKNTDVFFSSAWS
jgi:hypothetical protein